MKVFISYKRGDQASEGLVKALQERFGTIVFVDLTILPGANWEERLKAEIKQCDFFILLLSQAAADSSWVREELRRANYRQETQGLPKIVPVCVNFEVQQFDEELNKIVRPLQILPWRSDEDTAGVLKKIGELIAEREGEIARQVRRRRQRRAMVTAGFLVVVAVALAWFGHRLDAKAQPLLRSSARDEFDRGLLIAGLAALMRGSDPPPEVLQDYQRENYDKLLMTLPGNEELQGTALATWIDSRHLRIADGGRIWTCELPIETRRCSALPRLSKHFSVRSSAFKSDDEALFVGYGGEATAFELTGGGEGPLKPGIHVKSVAADGGDVAFGIEVSQPNEGTVEVDSKDGTSQHISSGSAQSVAFGPCGECVSVLGKDRSVKVWRMRQGTVVPLSVVEPVQAIASGRTAGRLAIVDGRDQLLLYEPNLAALQTRTTIPFPGTVPGGIALSVDGRWIAVVHASTVTVIGPDGSDWTLVSDSHTPRPVAAAFAGNDLIVTRTAAGVRIWRLGSAKRPHLAPYERWLEWRKQLGVTVTAKDDDREARFGDPAAREVRSYR